MVRVNLSVTNATKAPKQAMMQLLLFYVSTININVALTTVK